MSQGSSSFHPARFVGLAQYPVGSSGLPLIPCPDFGDQVVECKSWKHNGRVFFKCIRYDDHVSCKYLVQLGWYLMKGSLFFLLVGGSWQMRVLQVA